MGVDYVDIFMYVDVQFGDSRSDSSRDIKWADFVSNEQTNMTEAYHIKAKRVTVISPKNVTKF